MFTYMYRTEICLIHEFIEEERNYFIILKLYLYIQLGYTLCTYITILLYILYGLKISLKTFNK